MKILKIISKLCGVAGGSMGYSASPVRVNKTAICQFATSPASALCGLYPGGVGRTGAGITPGAEKQSPAKTRAYAG